MCLKIAAWFSLLQQLPLSSRSGPPSLNLMFKVVVKLRSTRASVLQTAAAASALCRCVRTLPLLQNSNDVSVICRCLCALPLSMRSAAASAALLLSFSLSPSLYFYYFSLTRKILYRKRGYGMSRRLPESRGEHSRGKAAEAAAVLKQLQSDEAAAER